MADRRGSLPLTALLTGCPLRRPTGIHNKTAVSRYRVHTVKSACSHGTYRQDNGDWPNLGVNQMGNYAVSGKDFIYLRGFCLPAARAVMATGVLAISVWALNLSGSVPESATARLPS